MDIPCITSNGNAILHNIENTQNDNEWNLRNYFIEYMKCVMFILSITNPSNRLQPEVNHKIQYNTVAVGS